MGYGQDLAYIHNAGFSDFARNAAPGLLGLLARSGLTRGLVVDVGCGSGVWAGILTRAGYRVEGIDISPAMIALARRKAPKARFRAGSLFDTELPPCDAVTAIGEIVNYRLDPRGDEKRLAAFFDRVRSALGQAGVFIIDFLEPGQIAPKDIRVRGRSGPDWAVLSRSTEDRRSRMLTRRITSFRKVGRLYRRTDEIHRLGLYTGEAILRALHSAGFKARLMKGYGRFRLARGHLAAVARPQG